MLKKLYLLLIFTLFVALQPIVYAHDSEKPIRVGVSTNDFSKYVYNDVEISATSDFDLIDAATGEVLPDVPMNTVLKVKLENGYFSVLKGDEVIKTSLEGPVIIRTQKGGLLYVNGLKRGGKEAFYRGIFEIVKRDKQFVVVNVLSLENYLKGVVPNEMPVYFGIEALKAQTVAARNYALRPRTTFYKEYDVCDSVACQVYFGANTEKELSNQAIKETNGIVALDRDDKLILALYSSTAGGYTESYENAFSDPVTGIFPARPLHYLKAVPDNPLTPKLDTEEAAKAFYTTTPATFDNDSRYFRWERSWKADELENVLKKTLVEQSTTGFVKPKLTKDNVCDFGKIKDIVAAKRGESGKIAVLTIITDKGNFNLEKELVIRRTFKKDGKAIPSGNFVITKSVDENGNIQFLFQGGGYGHGVGMSQFGAGGMAKQGFKFDAILQHYYSGVKLATSPLSIYSTEGKNTQDQIFYTNTQKGFLNIDNKGYVDKIKVILNGNELEYDFPLFSEKKMRVDVSKYIIKGQNTVVYCIPNVDGRKKEVVMYIEIKEAENGGK